MMHLLIGKLPLLSAVMNERVVAIKVDREERPDVDAVYMDRHAGDDRPGRLADDGVPDAGRRAVLLGTYFPRAAASGMPRSRRS